MAAATRTITCEDCGTAYETRTKNAKRCKVCQLRNRLEWLKGRTRTCIIKPEHEYIDVFGGSIATCGEHDLTHRAQDASGECRICGQASDRLAHEDVAICRSCITKPENLEEVTEKIVQKQLWLAQNARAES